VSLTITTIRDVFTTNKDITIVQQPIANPVSNISICDDISNDGMAIIDFTPIYTTVLGSQSINDYQVTIHETLVDAQNGFNVLSHSYNAISGTYYARVDILT